MPRTGGVYNAPAGTKGVPNTTIQSAPYNSFIDDLVADANGPRPVTAGGTGASNVTDARTNLGALAAADLLASATKALPVDNDAAIITDSEDGGKIKRVLWTVIKARLRTFFDNVYQARLADQVVVELNANQTVASGSFIDLHAQPGSDFEARIARNQGANGTLDILNNGTGKMQFYANSGTYFNAAMVVNGRVTAIREFMVQAESSAANSHLYMMDSDGATVRAILYAQQNKSAVLAVNGGGVGFGFNVDGSFTAQGRVYSGNAFMQTDGNIGGAAYTGGSVIAHIDNRASVFATNAQTAATNASVTQSQFAGYIAKGFDLNQSTAEDIHNSGYVLVRAWKDARLGIYFASRQPQLYVANRGWFALGGW